MLISGQTGQNLTRVSKTTAFVLLWCMIPCNAAPQIPKARALGNEKF
jgi:hypothetical protein